MLFRDPLAEHHRCYIDVQTHQVKDFLKALRSLVASSVLHCLWEMYGRNLARSDSAGYTAPAS